jgi:hypothetical protein
MSVAAPLHRLASRLTPRRASAALLAPLLLATAPAPARAGFADLTGHLSIGYSHLFAKDAPGGSLSATAGIDHPIHGDLGAGVLVGFHLLGGRTVSQGSLLASLDYSVFEADLLFHWATTAWGPVGRISVGPAVVSARADLSSSGGGAAFSHLAIEEVAPGVALDVTVLPATPRPVRVGLELGLRHVFLPNEDWKVASARVAFHY